MKLMTGSLSLFQLSSMLYDFPVKRKARRLPILVPGHSFVGVLWRSGTTLAKSAGECAYMVMPPLFLDVEESNIALPSSDGQ